LFNPVLRKCGTHRLVYSTSIGFRIVFLLTAGIIIASVASVGEGSFFERVNFVALIIIGFCLFAALYLERWIFDKKTNGFEKNVGLVFFHSRRRHPLDALQKVVLEEPGWKINERAKMLRWMSRRTAILSVVDRDGRVYGLDMVKGGSVREVKKSAELLSDFCGIPLEDHLGNFPDGVQP
jgi:hypothetical protein